MAREFQLREAERREWMFTRRETRRVSLASFSYLHLFYGRPSVRGVASDCHRVLVSKRESIEERLEKKIGIEKVLERVEISPYRFAQTKTSLSVWRWREPQTFHGYLQDTQISLCGHAQAAACTCLRLFVR